MACSTPGLSVGGLFELSIRTGRVRSSAIVGNMRRVAWKRTVLSPPNRKEKQQQRQKKKKKQQETLVPSHAPAPEPVDASVEPSEARGGSGSIASRPRGAGCRLSGGSDDRGAGRAWFLVSLGEACEMSRRLISTVVQGFVARVLE